MAQHKTYGPALHKDVDTKATQALFLKGGVRLVGLLECLAGVLIDDKREGLFHVLFTQSSGAQLTHRAVDAHPGWPTLFEKKIRGAQLDHGPQHFFDVHVRSFADATGPSYRCKVTASKDAAPGLGRVAGAQRRLT